MVSLAWKYFQVFWIARERIRKFESLVRSLCCKGYGVGGGLIASKALTHTNTHMHTQTHSRTHWAGRREWPTFSTMWLPISDAANLSSPALPSTKPLSEHWITISQFSFPQKRHRRITYIMVRYSQEHRELSAVVWNSVVHQWRGRIQALAQNLTGLNNHEWWKMLGLGLPLTNSWIWNLVKRLVTSLAFANFEHWQTPSQSWKKSASGHELSPVLCKFQPWV